MDLSGEMVSAMGDGDGLGRLCIDTDTAGGLFFGDSGFAVTISGIDSINPLTLDIGAVADGVTLDISPRIIDIFWCPPQL